MTTINISTTWVFDDQLLSSFPVSMMDIDYYEPQDMIDVDYYEGQAMDDVDYYDGQDMEDVDYYDGQDMEDIDYYDGQDMEGIDYYEGEAMEGIQIIRTRRRFIRILRRPRNVPSHTTSMPLELQKASLGGLVDAMDRLTINDSSDMEIDDATKEDPEIMTNAQNATSWSVVPVTYHFGVEEKCSSTKRSSLNKRQKTMAKRRTRRDRSL